jgi:ribonuclease P protein component
MPGAPGAGSVSLPDRSVGGCGTSFPARVRLTHPQEFQRVFQSATVRSRHGPLRLSAVPNRMQTARLGLVVGKRILPGAVKRNRARRVLREAFRQARCELPAMDIVVQVLGEASSDAYRQSLRALLAELRNQHHP